MQTERYRAGISTELDQLTSELALTQAQLEPRRGAVQLSDHARAARGARGTRAVMRVEGEVVPCGSYISRSSARTRSSASSILMLIFGIVAILRMPIDIFPAINIPVVSVLWSYGGLSPTEMEQRVVTLAERVYSSYVNDIEHIESQSLNGLSIIKVYFQPDADVAGGHGAAHGGVAGRDAQHAAGHLAAVHDALQRDRRADHAARRRRVRSAPRPSSTTSRRTSFACRSATVHGATVPPAYGGVPRVVNVDIDPQALFAKGLSPADVSRRDQCAERDPAVGHGADGRARVLRAAQLDARLARRSSPTIPLKQVNGATVYRRRRRAGARRRRRADEHRARERTPRHVSHGAQERQGVDARHRRPGEGDAAADPRGTAGRREAQRCSATSRCTCARRSPACCAKA